MRFGLFFAMQNPPGGIPDHVPYRDMLRCLPRAEELGYETVLMASHHVQPDSWCSSPLVALAGAAAVTERMRIGTAVLLVPLYAPLKLAEDVAVLDNLCGGRLVLGVAPGYVSEEFAAHGIPRAERVPRMEEALDLLQAAWTSERFSFEGRFYRVEECGLSPKPVQQPHPPLWYGVSGPKSIARAAKRGAVLVASPRHGIPELAEHYRIYEEACADHGFPVPERPVIREIFVAETREEAERIAAPALTYLFRELYGAKSAEGERVLRADDGTVVTDKSQVDFEHFKGRYVIGSPDDAITELTRYRDELGATEIIGWMHLPGIPGDLVMKSVELFARRVMPAFRG